MHELSHIKNMDVILKLSVDFLCTFFWWNPIIWYLEKEIFQFLVGFRNIKIYKSIEDVKIEE